MFDAKGKDIKIEYEIREGATNGTRIGTLTLAAPPRGGEKIRTKKGTRKVKYTYGATIVVEKT